MLSKPSIHISSTRMLMVAPHRDFAVHQHAVLQVTFALDDQPFEVWTEATGWASTTGVIIDANIPHALRVQQGWQATTCIIPQTAPAKWLKESVLQDVPVLLLNGTEFNLVKEDLLNLSRTVLPDGETFDELTNRIYNCLLKNKYLFYPMDQRIRSVLLYIQEHITEGLSAAELAAHIHLSENRFLHLFKEKMGIPVRQYIVWQRMATAFGFFLAGRSLKEAAYESGFSDPAHFTRSFVQINGVQPSAYAPMKDHFAFRYFPEA